MIYKEMVDDDNYILINKDVFSKLSLDERGLYFTICGLNQLNGMRGVTVEDMHSILPKESQFDFELKSLEKKRAIYRTRDSERRAYVYHVI